MSSTIIICKDGSSTLKQIELEETYHSQQGAYTEAMHIYINEGINYLSHLHSLSEVNIFDVGLGTGVNCILTYLWQIKREKPIKINYYGIEKFPLLYSKVQKLKYPQYIAKESNLPEYLSNLEDFMAQLHMAEWDKNILISTNFNLYKINGDISTYNFSHLSKSTVPTIIYYDTFSPNSQPELWDQSIFERLYMNISNNSTLVTYCSKGIVKQGLRCAGFNVQRLPGPPMKRHIIRATK